MSDPKDNTAAAARPEPPAEFLALLAHELRNPLSPIRNGAVLLRSLCSDPRQLQVVEMISRNVVTLTRMLDDLLGVARLERGSVCLEKQSVDVGRLIRNALENARPAIDARRQSVLVALPAADTPLYCDPVRIEQIVQILLDNANQYTPDGGVLSVKAEVQGSRLFLEVADNGSGIDPELLPQLFNVFDQSRPGTDWRRGRLGLGLAIARNLVELHGGTLAAESAGLACGSRFTVILPLALPAPAQVPRAGDEGPRPARILLVDDFEDIARSLAQYLRADGHTTITASSGRDGLQRAHEFHPEVVILDIGLPDIGGIELARRLRALPGLAGVFLIAVTAHDEFIDRYPGLFDAYLIKPADPSIIAAALARRPQRSEHLQ